jgi:8-oxo-dGTP pyrophosphatase MutT (NUDIX family)
MSDRTFQWRPNVTVAAVVEDGGRFLLVEEHTAHGLAYNQPAGHLEAGESLVAAARRECLEETACAFDPQALVGVYRYREAASDITYLRFAFAGRLAARDPARPLDEGIVRAVWLSVDEIRTNRERHRSPLVMRCVEDYLAGRRYPLELIHDCGERA